MSQRLGVIGGSGFYEIPGLRKKKWKKLSTPFGKPSDAYLTGILGDQEIVFLARHGRGHVLLPHEINFRANIYGMKKLGVSWLVAASAVGSLREEMRPLDFVIPDQFVDRTTKRDSTFFGNGIAAHISFADPFCGALREALLKECRHLNIPVHSRGTYLNMEGPAFSTRAESHLYRSWGMDIIGMTNLAEAKLAREAEICYATMAMVTDYDCWHEQHDDVTVEAVIQNLMANAANALKVIQGISGHLPQTCGTGCPNALAASIITAKNKMPASAKKKLKLLLQKYL